MKKVISFALVLALIFSLAACGKKKNSDIEVVKDYESQPVSGDSEGGQKTALNLTSFNKFVNGYAWVKSSGSESYSLIDTSGKIICTSTAIEIHDMSNDACYVKEKVGDKDGEAIYNYKIINKNGKIVASSTDGKFDEILAAGDNLFFVHKYESSIDVSRHLYGTINEKGEFVNKLRECPYGELSETYTSYIGAKAFRVGAGVYDDPYIYMSSIDKYIGNNAIAYGTQINIGNNLYIVNGSGIKVEGSDTGYYEYDDDGYAYVVIRSDGKVEKAPAFDEIINGMLVKRDREKESVSFTDPATGKTATFSKYYPVYIDTAGKDNFLIMIEGADGKYYYTILDKNGNMLFEPIEGTRGEIYSERAAGETYANDSRLVLRTDEGYSVLDYTGKVIIPAGTYSYIGAFNSGIAWAKNSSDQYVGIDVNGKVVIS